MYLCICVFEYQSELHICTSVNVCFENRFHQLNWYVIGLYWDWLCMNMKICVVSFSFFFILVQRKFVCGFKLQTSQSIQATTQTNWTETTIHWKTFTLCFIFRFKHPSQSFEIMVLVVHRPNHFRHRVLHLYCHLILDVGKWYDHVDDSFVLAKIQTYAV